MEIQELSKKYAVRKLDETDTDAIFALCCQNEIFYRFHPPFVTKKSILEDMSALPPGKQAADKFYIGFERNGKLAAVMDLVLDYPGEGAAYIGFFMMDKELQGQGIGTEIIGGCARCLSRQGYGKIRLAIDKGNPQSEAFWKKNGFAATGEEIPNPVSVYIPMERALL